MTRLLTLLLCCLAASAGAQTVTLPAEIRGGTGSWVIVAPEAVDGGTVKWRIDAGLQEVRLDLLLPPETIAKLRGKVLTALVAGRYRVEAWTAKGDVPSDIATCWVVIGQPGPTPPDPPNPEPDPPDPTPSGLRSVMLIHESAEKTPAWAITINQLRTGAQAKYLSDRKTRLDILDDESLAGDARWTSILAGLTLPAVIVTDSKTRVVVHKQAVPLTATADEILAIIKTHGG